MRRREGAGAGRTVGRCGGRCGPHAAEAYQELHQDWQPTLTDIEVSNQRAAELTAARAEIARLQAENARLPALSRSIIGRNVYQDLQNVYPTLNDFDLSSDEARRRVLLFLHGMSTQHGWGWAAPPQPLQGMTQAEALAVPGAIGAL